MKFNKRIYWDRRKKGFRGQISALGTKEFDHEQRKIERHARKLWLEKQKEKEAKEEKSSV